MRFAALLFVLLISNICLSQCLKYDDLVNATKKPEGKFTWYVSKSGEVFNEGDKITIGQPSNKMFFSYILVANMDELSKADASWSGKSVDIKKLYLEGTKANGFNVIAKWNNLITAVNIDIENALASGELVSSIMTSDQALAELKKAKDKLDLGLITQVEYDSIKTILALLIK